MIQTYRQFTPRIHPSAWVHPAAVVIGDVWLGPQVSVWPGAVLRGDCGTIRIGACTNLQDGAVVHTTQDLSQTVIGERVTVGHNAILHGCRVGNDCLVGMHATLLDNCEIGDHSIVAAGSVVALNAVFAARSMVVGSPAVLKRAVSDRNLRQIDYAWQAYLGYREPFLQGEVRTLPDDFRWWPDGEP